MKIIQTTTVALVACVFGFITASAHGAIITFVDEAAFQSSLTGAFTLVNLDGAPLNANGVPYNVEDAGPASDFATLGIDFVLVAPGVIGGQAFQISKPGRDRLILNGSGGPTGGDIAFDLIVPMNGVGAWSNFGDGGQIRAFDGPGLTGTLLGEAPLAAGSFAGIISTGTLIQSIEITCEFDADLICGIFDIQFGAATVVPLPTALWLFGSALGLLGWSRRR